MFYVMDLLSSVSSNEVSKNGDNENIERDLTNHTVVNNKHLEVSRKSSNTELKHSSVAIKSNARKSLNGFKKLCNSSEHKLVIVCKMDNDTLINEPTMVLSPNDSSSKQDCNDSMSANGEISTSNRKSYNNKVIPKIDCALSDMSSPYSGSASSTSVKSEVLSDCESALIEEPVLVHETLANKKLHETSTKNIKVENEKTKIVGSCFSHIYSGKTNGKSSDSTKCEQYVSPSVIFPGSDTSLLSSVKSEIISDCESSLNEEQVSSDEMLENEDLGEVIKESGTSDMEEMKIIGSYHCEICSKEFQLESDLKLHLETHDMTEINYDNFDIYIEHVTGKLPFQCRICGKGFTRKQTAKHHHVIHTGQKPHVCHICQKAFRHRSALYKHKRSHSGVEPAKHPCNVCGKLFKHKSYLNIHAIIHTEERPYICDICGSTFKDRSARNKHVQAHSGIKPYSCEVCGKCFGRKGDYKSHLVIHTEDRPYTCSVCGRGFRSSSNCRRHSRIHTNSYPYKCDVCDKAFNQNWKLKEHKYTHTNEMPYVCEFCNATFRYSRKLKKHVEKHIRERFHSHESTDGKGDDCLFEIINVQPDISALIS